MRIGVYFGVINPQIGGGNTILTTIKKSIASKSFDSGDEFVFIYSGGRRSPSTCCIDGLTYINIDRTISLWQKTKRMVLEKYQLKAAAKYYRFDILAKEYDIDIFWIAVPVSVDVSYPFIYTVWDLGYRTVPYFPEVSLSLEWENREANYGHMIPKASFVITGDEEGKKEILDNFNVNPEKIRIIPFPISAFCYGEEKKPTLELPGSYFFYPAQFWAHKNHICILEAVRDLKYKHNMSVMVFFTGSDRGNRDYILAKAKEFGIAENIVVTGFLKDEELKYLYTHATAMIYASLMGPNNLPPIEATYLGCPVIITDLPGHKEQLGDSALYFNGYKPDELVHQMIRVMDENVRQNLKNKEAQLSLCFAEQDYFSDVLSIINEFRQIQFRWKS